MALEGVLAQHSLHRVAQPIKPLPHVHRCKGHKYPGRRGEVDHIASVRVGSSATHPGETSALSFNTLPSGHANSATHPSDALAVGNVISMNPPTALFLSPDSCRALHSH